MLNRALTFIFSLTLIQTVLSGPVPRPEGGASKPPMMKKPAGRPRKPPRWLDVQELTAEEAGIIGRDIEELNAEEPDNGLVEGALGDVLHVAGNGDKLLNALGLRSDLD
ncbi:hypothetical protein CPB84DRAFT_1747849 [Gymnopilus junonius]|uniref:Uncharacterized protein n=1 Tax=Gymnopilus junonius TaxID=109634 RepID=A0A9P5NMA4_GYMJU|nr:hypothetical protein CPB84DRAFT_1747849 [Gymnopilus junonius]